MTQKDHSLRDHLEDDILTGKLKPGERLDEVALAARFGVSRTPLREALFQLSAAGLVEHKPRRGNFVIEIGPKRLVEMFDVMAELESMCARLAAIRAQPEELEEIRATHAACAEAAKGDVTDDYYYENERFHQAIRKASRNTFLLEQAETLHRRLKAHRRMQLRARGRMQTSWQEHDEVVQAIEAGDGDKAAQAMRQHVEVQGERFTMLLESL